MEANGPRASSELLYQLLEGLPFGAVVMDAGKRITCANRLAAQLLEIEASDLASGHQIKDVISRLVARGDYGDGESETAIAHILDQIGDKDASFTQRTPSGSTILSSLPRPSELTRP